MAIEKERLEKILDIILNALLCSTSAQYVHFLLEDHAGLSLDEMVELHLDV